MEAKRAKDGQEDDPNFELVDVPTDGKTAGEIVMRGNLVMMEVCTTHASASGMCWLMGW